MWGAEANLRANLLCDCWYRLDGLAGFRYLELDEALNVREDLDVSPDLARMFPGNPAAARFAGTHITVQDSFHTRNEFFGGQLGAVFEAHYGPWVFDVRGTVGLGDTHQVVDINGNQHVTGGGIGNQLFGGGLLATSSNIGHFTRDRFTVVPEIGLTVGYQVTDNLRLFVGYDFTYWSSVVRPGDQVDRSINPRNVPNFVLLNPTEAPRGSPNPARPAFVFHGTDFWAQGATFGAEIRY
jgi:hypothetical protein